jgi:nicotinate-nucleotide adenylyltransferase
MKTAVYSGSFNPLHIGHLAILKHLTGAGGYDCVRLVVSPKNPLKESISSASGPERYQAALEAVNRHFPPHPEVAECVDDMKTVIVDDIELTMPEPHYTIRTLDTLKEKHPEDTFTLVIGSDNLADIRRWKDYARILTEYGVLVYPRTGFDTAAIKTDLQKEDPSYQIEILDAELIDISSTFIREGLANGLDMSKWLM